MFVRWANLSIDEEQRTQLPGYREPAVVRHFDAPEALDVRFYEVRAKSALNRVPERSRMPFRWTINPYRGCTHACVYCLVGDTPVLLADGTERALADLAVGDRVVGTTPGRGGHPTAGRRLAVTDVRAHWSTVEPAYRVALSGGVELQTSGDHRFLTPRGWCSVTAPAEPHRRGARLVAGDELIGVNASVGTAAPCERTRVVAIEPLGRAMRMYDITTGTGDFVAAGVISHNCFARPTHEYLDLSPGRDFEREIVVKVNAPEVLRRELARPSWTGEHVAMGTNTDPYQWVEGRYKLMRGIWEALRDARNPCSVLTKSPLLLRDLDLLRELNEVTDVSASLSIPTIDERAWRATEPHTPSPRARLEAVAELTRSGIRAGVLIAPLMPGINDDPRQIAAIAEAADAAGADSIGGIPLHLRGAVRDVFMDWLRSARPELVPRYEALYARGAYLRPADRDAVTAPLRPYRRGSWRGTDRREQRSAAASPPAAERAAPRQGEGVTPTQASLF